MHRPARTTIAAATFAGALAMALVEPAGDGVPALALHPLVALGALVLAVASAVILGIEIGRGLAGAAGPVAGRVRTDAATRAETEFLANMSHELRTPLNAVIGFAELILDETGNPACDPRHAAYARHIRDGGERVLAIVEAVMDLSQLAAGQVDLRPRRVEPQAIVEECARSLAAQAAAARVELDVRPTTAAPFAADPAKLNQALTNLMSNAIKFAGPGGRVSIAAADGGRDAVAFEIADTGIGMTPGEAAVALQPFRMIEGSMTRRHGGVGLGLTLADRLVRLHGGKLRIDSRPGRGTTVTAILPRAAPDKHANGDLP